MYLVFYCLPHPGRLSAAGYLAYIRINVCMVSALKALRKVGKCLGSFDVSRSDAVAARAFSVWFSLAAVSSEKFSGVRFRQADCV